MTEHKTKYEFPGSLGYQEYAMVVLWTRHVLGLISATSDDDAIHEMLTRNAKGYTK